MAARAPPAGPPAAATTACHTPQPAAAQAPLCPKTQTELIAEYGDKAPEIIADLVCRGSFVDHPLFPGNPDLRVYTLPVDGFPKPAQPAAPPAPTPPALPELQASAGRVRDDGQPWDK
eukprot:12236876-Alexandrium_andersonii.AAC.1